MSVALLGWLFAAWPTIAQGPHDAPPPPATTSVAESEDLNQRLGKLEDRLGGLMKQNELLLRENQALADKVMAPGANPAAAFGPDDTGSQIDSGSSRGATSSAPTAGGGSRAGGGGDPTTIGRAQEVGNEHLGKVGLNPYYDFDNGGFHVSTKDEEFSFGLRGMSQVDGMLYSRPTPGINTSSGFYNPRSRIYFEGVATQPITWEFSFQNFYDTVQLLDAYVNFNYDPRFQVEIGRYKNPFGYEFYRIHIWDLMAPERSLWSVNYEANRRFGVMAHGDLADQRIEYAVGSFNSQRNSLQPFNSRQDFQAFVNFKPFYPSEEGFLLRNLQIGGSCDVGNENQPPVPGALRINVSPGPATVTTPSAANSAEAPFLAFNSGVLEHGVRALWEAHLAYYFGGCRWWRRSKAATKATRPRPGRRSMSRSTAGSCRPPTSSRARPSATAPSSSRCAPSTCAATALAWVPGRCPPALASSTSVRRSSPLAWPTRSSGPRT
jgi:phosphate-selective porin OprO/OprP